jgi:hypothetical protein
MKTSQVLTLLAMAGVVLVAVAQAPTPTTQQTSPPAMSSPATAEEGDYDPTKLGNPDAGTGRLVIARNGKVSRADGREGGNWVAAQAYDKPGAPPAEVRGKEVAVVRVYINDPGADAGNFQHPVTSGPTHPPYNTHCHTWYQIGGKWYWAHC